MKTLLTATFATALCMLTMSFHFRNAHIPSTSANTIICVPATTLIGSGTIKDKGTSAFTVHSTDGNDYLAELESSFIVGDSVYHSDPEGGWVEILGLVEDQH